MVRKTLGIRVREILLGGTRWQVAAGWILILTWMIWWAVSLFPADKQADDQTPRLADGKPFPALVNGKRTWMGPIAWPFLGLDFIHEYSGGRKLASGHNPYKGMEGHIFYDKFAYPPIVLPFYLWAGIVPPDQTYSVQARDGAMREYSYPQRAIRLWTVVMGLVFGWTAYMAWRGRQAAGSQPLAFSLVAGLILLSFPVIFAMERGSCDLLMLVPIMLAGRLLSRTAEPGTRRAMLREIGAGILIGLAAWIKLYPAMLVLPLLAMRKWKAAIASVAMMAVIGMATFPWAMQWIQNVKELLGTQNQQFIPFSHTLSGHWNLICQSIGFEAMGKIPGGIGAALVVGPIALGLAWLAYHKRQSASLALPILLWTTALATFWPLISFDYNLFYLPLAAVIVWDRNDPWWVHMGGACLLLTMQPWGLADNAGGMMLLLKFFALIGIGLSLAVKLRAMTQPSAVRDSADYPPVQSCAHAGSSRSVLKTIPLPGRSSH